MAAVNCWAGVVVPVVVIAVTLASKVLNRGVDLLGDVRVGEEGRVHRAEVRLGVGLGDRLDLGERQRRGRAGGEGRGQEVELGLKGRVAVAKPAFGVFSG